MIKQAPIRVTPSVMCGWVTSPQVGDEQTVFVIWKTREMALECQMCQRARNLWEQLGGHKFIAPEDAGVVPSPCLLLLRLMLAESD